MIYKKISLSLSALLAIGLFLFSSCSKEAISTPYSTENFDQYGLDVENRDKDEKCFEMVWPISIEFKDGTSAEVTSKENMREVVKEWFEKTNTEKSRENRPDIVFPIQIVKDGETVDVASQEDFKDILQSCHKGRKHGKKRHCYKIVFPVEMDFNGDVKTLASKEELRDALKEYREAKGEDDPRPEFVFPINVTDKDGNEIAVASKEEWKELNKECHKGRRPGKRGHCYNLVFPVQMDFNGDVKTLASKEELRDALKAYRETKGEDDPRPEFVFPINVTDKDGNEITVASQEEWRELNKECHKGRGHKLNDCFSVVFPVSMDFNGEVKSFESEEELKEAVKAYREAKGEDDPRPEFVFPINVTDKDGNESTINSKDDFKELLKSCRKKGKGRKGKDGRG